MCVATCIYDIPHQVEIAHNHLRLCLTALPIYIYIYIYTVCVDRMDVVGRCMSMSHDTSKGLMLFSNSAGSPLCLKSISFW